jgi:uncharacterized protein (DUF2461 family)
VVDPVLGPTLNQLITNLKGKGYDVGHQTYKRVPRGYAPDHQYADLLRYSGFTMGIDLGLPETLRAPTLIDTCFEIYRHAQPMIAWLQRVKETVP